MMSLSKEEEIGSWAQGRATLGTGTVHSWQQEDSRADMPIRAGIEIWGDKTCGSFPLTS